MLNIFHLSLLFLIARLAQCNTEAGFFHTNSIDVLPLNNTITKISQMITKDEVLSLAIPNKDLDKFREFYIPINQTDLVGFYNIRISWDALSPIDIYKFDVIQANNTQNHQTTFVYLKYKYDCFPLVVFKDNLDFKILLSSTVLGFIPLDMVPVVKLIFITAVVGLIGGHYIYQFLISI